MKKKKPFSELVIGLICIVLGAAVYVMACGLQQVKLGIGPSGFPKFTSILLAILGVAQTVMTLKAGVNAPTFNIDKRATALFLGAVALSAVYVMLVSTVGFLIMTTLLVFGMILLFGDRNYPLAIGISVATSVSIWLLFTKVFMIFLPAGRLF